MVGPVKLQFNYNPQDTVTTAPRRTFVDRVEVSPEGGVQTDTVKLNGALEPKDGEYVFDPRNTRRFTASCAFSSVANTVEGFQSFLDKPIKWAHGGQHLSVTGNAGSALNAFYSRDSGGVFFYAGKDPVTMESVYTGCSGEVTAHEAGHALLDSLRPGYLKTFGAEVAAFHEAFGDVMALFTTLREPDVAARVADAGSTNLASAFAEQLGMALNHTQGKDVTGGDWARNACNSFVYADPAGLPKEAPPDQLTSDPHNFARLWTGANYEVFQGLVAGRVASGMGLSEALQESATEGLKLYATLLQTTAPEGFFTFKDMAAAWVASAGDRAELVRDVMTRRGILTAGVASGVSREVTVQLDVGRFAGCECTALARDEASLQADLARLARDGRILWTEPNQRVSPQELSRYTGVVRWNEGKPVIERVTTLT